MPVSLKQRALRITSVGLIVGLSVLGLYALGILGSEGGGAGIENAQLLETERGAGQEELEVGPQVGKLAPDFEISDMDGARHRLSDFRGRIIYINFWATWCTPCQIEMPDIQQLLNENPDDLTVISVNRGEGLDRARDFLRDIPGPDGGEGVSFTVNGLDPDDTLYDAYRGLGMPVSVFVDREGVVTEVVNGLISFEDMEKAVYEARG